VSSDVLTNGSICDNEEWDLGSSLYRHRNTLLEQIPEMSCREAIVRGCGQ